MRWVRQESGSATAVHGACQRDPLCLPADKPLATQLQHMLIALGSRRISASALRPSRLVAINAASIAARSSSICGEARRHSPPPCQRTAREILGEIVDMASNSSGSQSTHRRAAKRTVPWLATMRLAIARTRVDFPGACSAPRFTTVRRDAQRDRIEDRAVAIVEHGHIPGAPRKPRGGEAAGSAPPHPPQSSTG